MKLEATYGTRFVGCIGYTALDGCIGYLISQGAYHGMLYLKQFLLLVINTSLSEPFMIPRNAE